jgi:hypothetical protein
MASGSADASVLLWDTAGERSRAKPQAALSAEQLDKLWSDLAANDAVAAYQAICTLRASPKEAVQLLERHLKPVQAGDAKRVAEALRNLDSDDFTTREQAAKDLAAMGEAAEPALRKVLTGEPSAEVRQRVEKLLGSLAGADPWRPTRALELLEQIGTPESRRLLTTLASGAPEASRTREAQAALDRAKR